MKPLVLSASCGGRLRHPKTICIPKTMSYPIPFNKPCLTGNEYKYIAEAIANGHASGDGPFTRRCHELLETELQVPKVLLTTSCTHALEMAALLLDIAPDDEVILPSF